MPQRSKVGHYDIVAELGRGGMGVVFKGFEASLQRHVAIKMLSESLAHDASVVERFFREARSMAQLNDPHIVQIYLIGEDQGQPYFAMEFVEGESLSQRLKRENLLEPFEAAKILLQVAQGLAAAHDRGVIHRDIKPANLLINQRGLIKVADFGIALATSDFNKKLTGTGQFVGTPGYLSPEVCLGKPVDQRSDLFALGIVFFEMLTGRTPYKDESPLGMMLEVVQAEIPDVRAINDAVDPQLSAILKRMVAKDPADRYADCHQLIADLVAAGVNTAISTPPRASTNPLLGTAVNMPTPPEMRRLQTPPLSFPPAAAERAVSAQQPEVPPAALPTPVTKRQTSLLPWAAAVAGLLATGAVSAWYFSGLDSAPAPDLGSVTASSTTASSFSAAAMPATPAPAKVSPDPEPKAAAASATEPQPTSAISASTAPDPAASMAAEQVVAIESEAEAAPPIVAVLAPVEVAAPPAPALASAQATGLDSNNRGAPAPRAGAIAQDASPQAAAIGARLSDMREQRRERREARAEGAPNPVPQYAKAAPAPAVETAPSYSGPPRVMVLAFGDPAVAASAESAVEERLDEAGLQLVDEDFLSGLSTLETGSADLPRLVNAAGRHTDYVVVVRVMPMGQQELTFYGESMTQYTARLDVSAYDIHNRRKVGAGWSTQVSFTHLNVDPNTREAIAPLLARIAQGLNGRGRG